MKPGSITFAPPMAKAILDNRKTETRRITQPLTPGEVGRHLANPRVLCEPDKPAFLLPRRVGEILRIRESVRAISDEQGNSLVEYRADDARILIENSPEAADRWFDLFHHGFKKSGGRPTGNVGRWTAGRYTPGWTSRMSIEVEGIRVERLHEISTESAIAEGIEHVAGMITPLWRNYEYDGKVYADPINSYASLWRTLHSKPGERWKDNPWVTVTRFRRICE